MSPDVENPQDDSHSESDLGVSVDVTHNETLTVLLRSSDGREICA